MSDQQNNRQIPFWSYISTRIKLELTMKHETCLNDCISFVTIVLQVGISYYKTKWQE